MSNIEGRDRADASHIGDRTVRGILPQEVMENSIKIDREMWLVGRRWDGTLDVDQPELLRHVYDLRDVRMPRHSYCEENGVMAFVTADGEFRIAPTSRALNQALTQAGFQPSHTVVPLSRGGLEFADSALREQWDLMKLRAEVQRDQERKSAWSNTYLAEAATRGIQLGVAGNSALNSRLLKADGTLFCIAPDSAPEAYPDAFNQMGRSEIDLRARQVGRYDTNNGLLAFVDETGATYLVPWTDQNIGILESAGYQYGGVFVPFSNGEVLIDPGQSALLALIRRESR